MLFTLNLSTSVNVSPILELDSNKFLPKDANRKNYIGGWDDETGLYTSDLVTPQGIARVLYLKGTRDHFAVHLTADVGVLILAENSDRLFAQFVNYGSVDMYIGTTLDVNAYNGIRIAPGQPWEDEYGTDAWYGITATGSGHVRGWEISS